jgi:hypothetical protein
MITDLSGITMEYLIGLPESELRNNVIKPLLKEIGFRHVEDYHGPRENGIDILFETTDFFNRPRYFGVSAKTGDLNKNSAPDQKSILTIYSQMDQAFETLFLSSNNEAVLLHGYYIITTGSPNREAKDLIMKRRSRYPYVDIINGQELFRIIQERDMLRYKLIGGKTPTYQSFSDENETTK